MRSLVGMVVDVVHVETWEDVWSVPVVTRLEVAEWDRIDAAIAGLERVLAHGREPVAVTCP